LFTVKVLDTCERRNIFKPDVNGGMVWYIDGSKTNKGTGTGENKWGLRREHSCSPELHTTVIQTEICAVNLFKACQELYIPPGITLKNSARWLPSVYEFSEQEATFALNNNFGFYNQGEECLHCGPDWYISCLKG
jgi:hypothetical protein